MNGKSPRKTSGEDRLPGDPSPAAMIERFIRVNHAGEAGAKRIYAGQLAILKEGEIAEKIRAMAQQETEHFETFDKIMKERGVRPTLLLPFWHVAGFAMGAGTALLGDRAAMVCTAAVEEAIDDHYRAQADYLGEDEADLRATIVSAHADEIDHRDIARASGAGASPSHAPLHAAIKAGTKAVIWLSERL